MNHDEVAAEIRHCLRTGKIAEVEQLRHEQVVALLTEIRDDQRAFVRAMQEPGPAETHVHEPKDGSPASAPFWVCACGHVHDDEERTG